MATVHCKDSFSCLDGSSECLCEVEDCSSGSVHFIRPQIDREVCGYKLSFGNSFVCNCPVRKELYNRYRI